MKSLTHIHTKGKSLNISSKFMILCWAVLVATHKHTVDCRLDTSGWVGTFQMGYSRRGLLVPTLS